MLLLSKKIILVLQASLGEWNPQNPFGQRPRHSNVRAESAESGPTHGMIVRLHVACTNPNILPRALNWPSHNRWYGSHFEKLLPETVLFGFIYIIIIFLVNGFIYILLFCLRPSLTYLILPYARPFTWTQPVCI